MFKRCILVCLIPFFLFYSVPTNAAEKKEERGWQDDTVYTLIIDRFSNGTSSNDYDVNLKNPIGFQGGDFQGIINRLDYLKDMGFTAISLSPLFDNDVKGYDGYRVVDFYKTDEHYGSISKFKQLVKEAHKRDMKVMVDFVTNQISPESKILKDTDKKDWVKGETSDHVPALNHDNPQLNQYLIDAAKWWIVKTDIDGYFLSNAEQSPLNFWSNFTKTMKETKKDIYLLGDVHTQDTGLIKKYEQAGFDGVMDDSLNPSLRETFSNINKSGSSILDQWEENSKLYKNPSLMGAYFDNKNMERYTRDMVKANQFPGTRWKLALTYLYTQPEIPFVYYGTEIAIDGGEAPENRKLMNFRTEKELIDYMTMIGEVRQKNPALRRGTMEVLYEKDGMMVYKREYKGDINIVAINNTDQTQGVVLPSNALPEDKELRGLLEDAIVRPDNGRYKIVLERESSEIYRQVEKTTINFGFFVILVIILILFFLFIFLAKKRGAIK